MSTSLSSLDADSTTLLGRLPAALVSAAAMCRADGLRQTIEGAAGWRDALLKGVLPSDDSTWPAGPIGQALRQSFPRGLLRFTRGNKDVADAVVENLLQIVDGLRSDWDNRVADELEEWLKAEDLRREQAAKAEEEAQELEEGETERKRVHPIPVGAEESQKKAAEIRASLEEELAAWAKARMDGAWGEQVDGWTSVSEVFGELQAETSFGWDLSKGILKHVGWSKVEEMNKLLKSLPQIAAIAKALGRAKSSDKEVGPEERIMAKVSRVREELQWVEAPHARTHTDGIHKSDDIPRMLPMEGSLYRHPVFRKLWKAKLIERSLACYQIKGIEKRSIFSEEWVEEQLVRKKLERGPIIVCLDTSGSMQGVPETVAKAITLEAMRLAHAEGRDCLLYAFSGYGDVTEHDLDLSPAGIESLCAFLCMSFHGGTDISGPISAATRKLDGAKWKRADIIMVSDGAFDVPGDTQETLEEAKKKHGLRIHGLLVSNGYHGSYGLSSMQSLCDPVHVFRDWEEVRGL